MTRKIYRSTHVLIYRDHMIAKYNTSIMNNPQVQMKSKRMYLFTPWHSIS
jgi:hypothetical protein